jgi:hypothetical protein
MRVAKLAGTRHEGRQIAALIGHGLVAVGVLRSYYSQATFQCEDRTQETEVGGVCINIRTVLTEDMPNAAVAFAKAIQPIMDMVDVPDIRAFMDGIDPLEKAPSDYVSQIFGGGS